MRAASEVIGGPAGRYAAAAHHARAHAAAILTALASIPVLIGIVLRIPCIKTAWGNDGQFWNACYSDLPNAYRSDNLAGGLQAWFAGGATAPSTGQPPVTGFLLALASSLVPDTPDEATRVRWFFSIWVLLLLVLLALTILLVVSSAPNPWVATHIALSPVVALALFVSADFVGVFLATVGMWLWGRRRADLAAVALGLAVAARSYPVLIVLAIVFLLVRTGRRTEIARFVGLVMLTTGVVLALTFAINRRAAGAAYTGWWNGGTGYGSPWLLPQYAGFPLPPWAYNGLTLLGWAIAVTAGAWLALGARRRPALAEVALVMVGIVLVTGKSFTVQSSLWLVPLVAWCALLWRDHLIWAVAEILNFAAVWFVIGRTVQADRALPESWYSVFAMARVLAVVWLVALVWIRARERWLDGPAPPGDRDTDGLAGPLTDAPDELLVRLR